MLDAAFLVHTKLGPGLLESVYEVVLAHELRKGGTSVERHKAMPIVCDGIRFDEAFRSDLVVSERVIVEIKSVVTLTPVHAKQLLTQLKEDVARSFHFERNTGIDSNRAGTPLMEIVTEPEIASPEEAFAFLTSLKQILIYGEVSDADMGKVSCVAIVTSPSGEKEKPRSARKSRLRT